MATWMEKFNSFLEPAAKQFKAALQWFRDIDWKELKEIIVLWIVRLRTEVKNVIDFFRVAIAYYPRLSFGKVDMALLVTYLFENPFEVSKRFLLEKGEEDVHCYGETPLTTMDIIAKQCQIKAADTVYELGCGRGRTCFWLHSFIGCSVVGIEQVPVFIERAKRVQARFGIEGIHFVEGDMLHYDYSKATVIYLYGTCLTTESIQTLISSLKTLPAGAKVISVSYPLTDYTSEPLFEVMKCFTAKFTWGTGEVFLQIKK